MKGVDLALEVGPGLYLNSSLAVIDHDTRRTVTEMDNVLFSSLTLNLAPLHLEAESGASAIHFCIFPPAPILRHGLEPDFYREFISRLGVDVAGWPDQDDRAAWPRLRELIGAAVAARPQAEWASIYEGTDTCVTPVLTFDEAARHPHNTERGVFERVGGVLHPSPAPRFSRTPARSPAAPETGPVDARRLLESWCTGRSPQRR